MSTTDSITKRPKGKHLTLDERGQIQALNEEGYSQTAIAKRLGINQSTVSRELKRGTVTQMRLINDKIKYYQKYYADAGQGIYEANRKHSKSRGIKAYSPDFLQALYDEFLYKKPKYRVHSLDSFVRFYERKHPEAKVPSTKTLYNWIDAGLLKIKNIDLPRKVSRRPNRVNKRTKPVGRNKKKLGTSIDQRPEEVLSRESFGHWELDLVLGGKGKNEAFIITLVERKTRYAITIKSFDKSAEGIHRTLVRHLNKLDEGVVKTITTDNGAEFAMVSDLEQDFSFSTYFTHAYSSWEKGSNEHFNGLIREFIPKKHTINHLKYSEIKEMTEAINQKPRGILNYRSAEECFIEQLSQLSQFKEMI